jgi:hypothetical protein
VLSWIRAAVGREGVNGLDGLVMPPAAGHSSGKLLIISRQHSALSTQHLLKERRANYCAGTG